MKLSGRLLSLVLLSCLLLPSAAAEPKYVSLTFDDGPTGCYTQQLRELLAQRKVRATFFLCGYRVEQYPELTAALAKDGHELGLHGYCHAAFNTLSPAELCAELTAECFQIGEITGIAPSLLRPPGGLLADKLPPDSVCREFPVILWSVDPMDWATDNAALVAERVLRRLQPGDIILLHDASDSSIQAAERIIDALLSQGYQFLTVSELAAQYGVTLEGGKSYGRFS